MQVAELQIAGDRQKVTIADATGETITIANYAMALKPKRAMKSESNPEIDARPMGDEVVLAMRARKLIAQLRARGFPTDSAESYLKDFEALYHARMCAAKDVGFGGGLKKV